ncbi:MAG: RsmD family RNA methyltransferase [Verrucomicrobia bacterium]|nr:RsmD family RNA methyltransferase [Verrucomicrobiota bacterium]
MRITGGSAYGKVIHVPDGLGVRPTPEKVRMAIFNSLGPTIDDASILELFGGSGALSLEALSRGARAAVCIEKSPRHARFIRDNVRDCGFNGSFEVRTGDAFSHSLRLRQESIQFDFLFADPPYGEKTHGMRSHSLAQKSLDDTNIPWLLKPDGLFLLGHARRDAVEIPSHWRECRSLKHGDNWIRMLAPVYPS